MITNSERNGARPKDGNRLGMAIIGDKEGAAALDGVRHRHGFGSGRRFIEQGGIGNIHGRQITHQGLKIQQSPIALSDLRLIRSTPYQLDSRGCCGESPPGRGSSRSPFRARIVDFVLVHDLAQECQPRSSERAGGKFNAAQAESSPESFH